MTDTEEFNLYLANLEEYVFDENKIVSIGWLSRTLDIGVDLSKKLLSTFTHDETFKSKLSTCWFLYGSSKSDPSSRKMLIVPETKLTAAKDKFEKITSQHVYSIQKTGNTKETDMNSVYLADQSAEKTIAQCSSLSNIKCDHVKVVPNRRNMTAPVTNSSKPPVTNNAKSSESTKKSPVKSTIGNMFNKKKEEIDKKKEKEKKETDISKEGKEKNKEEEEKSNKEVEKDKKVSASPVKKSSTGAGKKKGPEKGAGSANITSFFSKGASSLPPMKKTESKDKEDVKANTKTSKETNGNSNAKKSNKETKSESHTKKSNKETNESDDEAMDVDVDETDENVEPVKTVENVEKEKEKDQKKRPIKESKSSKSKKSSAKSSEGKKKVEKKEKETQRRRIRVFSDSSDSEQEEEPERERSVSPPPPSPPRAKPAISDDDDDDDVIPPTPEATVSNGGGSRKRKRKLVTKTMTDSSGFLRTVKEFETVSCSDSDGESTNPPTSGGVVKQDAKKQKVEKKSPPAANKTTAKSPTKSKQTSILSFFKKS